MAQTADKGSESLSVKLRYLFVWLEARNDIPKRLIAGGYSTIKLSRFSMTILALLSFSSVALGSTVWNSASLAGLWYGLVAAGYVVVAVIFLLGFRMWYGGSVAFFIVSAIVNLSLNNNGGLNPLGASGTVAFNEMLALIWVYLVVVGLVMMRYDKGSKLNDLLAQS